MDISAGTLIPLGGLMVGIVFGIAGRAGRFCTLAMLEDAYYNADCRRLRAFALAMATALAATQLLVAFGLIDPGLSIYRVPRLGIAGSVLGGLAFGLGMALVGTCGFGTLVRVGGGDLRAIVVFLVIGLAAMMTMRGLIGPLRITLLDPVGVTLSPAQGLDTHLVAWFGAGAHWPAVAALVLGLGFWALKDRRLRATPRLWGSGLAVGLAVGLGWLVTGNLGADPFAEPALVSATYVAPLGETLLYLMIYTGSAADFGIFSVLGVVLGSFVAAMALRRFRWEACDDARELKRHMVGALLMGVGGVTAMGCTIGQGLSAVSMLALSTPLVLGSIALGARLGLDYTLTGEWRPVLRGLLGLRTEER